jgi:hypothetical protein
MNDRPMQPAGSQPIGFWTTRCGEAVRARTQGALAAIGISQPQWWVLHQLSIHPDGATRSDVITTVGPNATPEVIADAIAAAGEKEWLVETGSGLQLTPAGAAVFDEAKQAQADLERERRQGISDEDYETTITVLQRTIANVGGDAWHW